MRQRKCWRKLNVSDIIQKRCHFLVFHRVKQKDELLEFTPRWFINVHVCMKFACYINVLWNNFVQHVWYEVLTALFTLYSMVHLEKLAVAQLVEKFHSFCGTRRFITLKITAFVMRHCAFWNKFDRTCYLYLKYRFTEDGVGSQGRGAWNIVHVHLHMSQLAKYCIY
jgi:hypothetical protein